MKFPSFPYLDLVQAMTSLMAPDYRSRSHAEPRREAPRKRG